MVRTVYGGRRDHLGTCLMNLANAWRFAEATSAEFVAWWPQSRVGRADMSLQALYPHLPFPVTEHPPHAELVFDRGMSKTPIDPGVMAGVSTIHYHWALLLLLAGENRRTAKDRARELVRSLAPDRSIVKAVADIVSATDIGNKAAVHVRRGDIITLLQESPGNGVPLPKAASLFVSRYADLGAYVDTIGESQVVAFSDSRDEVERLSAALPGQVMTMANFADLSRGLSPHQVDMVEMLVMAQAKKIIGPRSNFSGFAAFYGDVPFRDVRKSLRPKRLATALGAMFKPEIVREIVVAYEPWFQKQERAAAWTKLSRYVAQKPRGSGSRDRMRRQSSI